MMKRNNIRTAVIICLTLSACSRDLNVEAPDLEVNAAAIEVKAGEAVIFNLEGDADYITFWSGEVYSDYHFRDRRTMTPGVISTLSFSCEITDGIQKGQVSVLASDSFSGNCYDYDNLIHTDWTDITGRFTLPDGKGKTSSSAQDLAQFVNSDRPFHLAFRYRCRPQEQYGKASRWVISDLQITNHSEELGETVMYNLVNSGFRIMDPFSRTDAACLSSVSQTQIVMQGRIQDEETAAADMETEHWVISRPIDLTSQRDLGPDRPVALKGYAESFPASYTHIYDKPGVYEATFVASNQSIDSRHETVKSILITVTE